MAKMKMWRKKYKAAPYIINALWQLKPPDGLSVSEWAAKYRLLDLRTSAMPGPWSNRMTPYLVEIMDALSDYGTEEIVFCKSTQVGGTEALLNMLGWIIQQDPSPVLVVYPTKELGESVSENRIRPAIKASPELDRLFNEFRSQKCELQFEGMYVSIAGSNSPTELASRPVKYLLLDEVDKYPGATAKEADPIRLARERTKTFHNRKVYLTSTPTIKEGPIWKALEEAEVEKHYFVPCPHCGEMIEFVFNQLRWPEKQEGLTQRDRADQAAYICQSCGCVISDPDKQDMLEKGKWLPVRGSEGKKVGYHLNVLYSPFVRFSEIAYEWMMTKHDPERHHNFVNSWLAEPWEDTRVRTSAETLLERQTEIPQYEVPPWAKIITGGVDVQTDCFYWTIRAFGDHITSQNIAHGKAYSWEEIEDAMNTGYLDNDGNQYVVSLCLIDSGFDADSVYDFCVDNEEWAMPVKGSSRMMTTHFRISEIDRVTSKAHGKRLVMVDGDKYKDMIAARMGKENGIGAWMVYGGCDMEYARQCTSEHKVQEKRGGTVYNHWKPKGSHVDNHYLDCEVYALAAADMLGVRTMHLDDIREAEPGAGSQPDGRADEESWINANENWV